MKDKIEKIKTREDLSRWILELQKDFIKNSNSWENANLSSFLEGLSSWIEDSDGYYLNVGKDVPEKPEWKNFAEALLAATMYE